MTWQELFPEGRVIFYEGNDPKGFRTEIKQKFGFDVKQRTVDFHWLVCNPDGKSTWNKRCGYSFHCPPEHLDAIYGNGVYPMGS